MTDAPQSLEEAQAEIARLRAKAESLERKVAWSEGRRGDGLHRAPGFTIAETRILRILASVGFVGREQVDALQRHMSNIRKKLKACAPSVTINTIVMEGYELTQGKADLQRLLLQAPGGEAQRPTPTQRILAERAQPKELTR